MKDQTYLEKVDQRDTNENVFAPISSDIYKVGQLPAPKPNGDNLPAHIVSAATITGESITFHPDPTMDKLKAVADKPTAPPEVEAPPTGWQQTYDRSHDADSAAKEKLSVPEKTSMDVNPRGNVSHVAANHPMHAGHDGQ